MTKTKHIFFAVLGILMFTSELFSQTDRDLILEARNASNQAFQSYNNEQILSFLTDDVLITTGNGTLLSGKKALEQYILDNGTGKMYFKRTPNEIVVNEKRGLAWESGTWNGNDPEKDDDSVIRGNYSAMWTKKSGVWKIKSQLFVTIAEN